MYTIRSIQQTDNPQVANLIRVVLAEFKIQVEGSSAADPHVETMAQYYSERKGQYFVISDDNHNVYGGGGFAPLLGVPGTCEVQKLYFLPQLRGQGFGEKLLITVLDAIYENGFHTAYLESSKAMSTALKLYAKLGFEKCEPRGNTGHQAVCDHFMALDLSQWRLSYKSA